MHGETMKFVEF